MATTPGDASVDDAEIALGVADSVDSEPGVLRTHLATTVYLQCAGLSRFRVDDLDVPDASARELETALGALTARGLVTQLDDDTWVANPPDQSLADRASRLEEQAATIRAAAPGLARAYYEAQARLRNGDRDVGVELLDSLDDVNSAMSELFRSSRQRVFSMRTSTPRVLSMMGQDPDRVGAPVRNSAGETLQLRVTFDTALLSDEGLPETIARRMRVDDIRFAGTVPFTASASDTGITVVEWPGRAAGSVGARISHPGLSASLRKVIDVTWTHGMRWAGLGSVTASNPAPLDQRDREILGLLLGGAADATIARQVGISQRTVERRVRRMLELLDATTRFQAGVKASRRGWI